MGKNNRARRASKAKAPDEVDDFVAEHFGELTEGSVRGGYDSSGWASGRLAADNARLSLADLESAHG